MTMNHEDFIKGLASLSNPDQGMRYHGGGLVQTGPRFDEQSGERLTPRYRHAELTVYGDRAKFLYALIADADKLSEALAARAQPPAGEAVAWIIEDLILPYVSITQDRRYADMKRDYRYEGEPTAKVTPLYAHPTEPAARDGREALQQIVDDLRIAVPGLRDALMACQTDVRELMADLETQKPISLAKTEIFGKLEFPVIHVEQALRMGEDWLSSPPASGEVQNG